MGWQQWAHWLSCGDAMARPSSMPMPELEAIPRGACGVLDADGGAAGVAKPSIPLRLHSPKVMRLQCVWLGGPGPCPVPVPIPVPVPGPMPIGCLFMAMLLLLLVLLLLLLLLLLWLLQLPLTFLLTDAILSLWATPALVLALLPAATTTDVAAVVGVVNMRSFPFNRSSWLRPPVCGSWPAPSCCCWHFMSIGTILVLRSCRWSRSAHRPKGTCKWETFQLFLFSMWPRAPSIYNYGSVIRHKKGSRSCGQDQCPSASHCDHNRFEL